jgi:hypothetical protein
MANKQVKSSATGTMGINAAKRARYERSEVAYGKIPAAAYTTGDVLVFNAIPMKELIHARFVAGSASLELFNSADLAVAHNFDIASADEVDIDYVVIYRQGNINGTETPIKLTTLSTAS